MLIAFAMPAYPSAPISAAITDNLGKIDLSNNNCGPKIVICIEIGRKRKGCTGFGICGIEIGVELSVPENNKVKANAWIDGGTLRVEFDKSTLTSDTYQTYFKSGVFKIEEDVDLASEVANALGISAYTIRAGEYNLAQLKTNPNMLTATF